MHNALGPNTRLGYCTNVHAGPTYDQTLANLQRHALGVKQRISPDAPMGLGLWLSAQAARQVVAEQRTAELRDWLHDRGLFVFTLNGFPYGDFHDDVVKHRVYTPDWSEHARLEYTLNLARILAEFLPDDGEGSISTLPIGWGNMRNDTGRLSAAGAQLTEIVHHLARLELDTGKHIHIDLEPEPGCMFDTSSGAVDFFKQHLLGTVDDLSVRSYLRLCHDVCHAAVMFEDQRDALRRYTEAGLSVGKVQLSSALRVPFDDMNAQERGASLDALRPFAEGRYLHQTVVRTDDGQTHFYDNLPEALRSAEQTDGPCGEWRVHFHVPINLDRIGALHTTQDAVRTAIRAATAREVRDFEVETYAWPVLPEALQHAELADGLAEELRWVQRHAAPRG